MNACWRSILAVHVLTFVLGNFVYGDPTHVRLLLNEHPNRQILCLTGIEGQESGFAPVVRSWNH